MVDIWSAGNYGAEEERKRRLTRPLCFLRKDATDNGYAHPIEGLNAVVDLKAKTVLRSRRGAESAAPAQPGGLAPGMSQRVEGT